VEERAVGIKRERNHNNLVSSLNKKSQRQFCLQYVIATVKTICETVPEIPNYKKIQRRHTIQKTAKRAEMVRVSARRN